MYGAAQEPVTKIRVCTQPKTKLFRAKTRLELDQTCNGTIFCVPFCLFCCFCPFVQGWADWTPFIERENSIPKFFAQVE